MQLSTRLTPAMVALVLFTATSVGYLAYRDALLGALAAGVCAIVLAVLLARASAAAMVGKFGRDVAGSQCAQEALRERMAREIIDLTQRIAAEERTRQSQKMEALGQLVGGIAHDFNNMLTIITGTIEILADGVADDPQLASIATLISAAADRGAELTGHMLAFARKQPLQPRQTDVNELVHAVCRQLRPSLGGHIEIKAVLEDDTWPALVDPAQLTIALVNLAANAGDAMPGGGKLVLETSNVVLEAGHARLDRDAEPGSYVMIVVSDTGTGMAPAILERVFEPFFTTKEAGRGTGLGLSMVYGFVKQSSGCIGIDSKEGHGTTIKIYLPRSGAPAERAVAPGIAPARDSEAILVVADDPLGRNRVTAPDRIIAQARAG